MTIDVSFVRLRIHELNGRILARRRLAEQNSERGWHLDYVEAYEAEMPQLQAELQTQTLTTSGHLLDAPTMMDGAADQAHPT
jgi:deoxyadenosine/deoxycytidine kinase